MKSETDDFEIAIMCSLPFLNQIIIVYGTISVQYVPQSSTVLSCSKDFLEAWQSTHLLQPKNGMGEIHVF